MMSPRPSGSKLSGSSMPRTARFSVAPSGAVRAEPLADGEPVLVGEAAVDDRAVVAQLLQGRRVDPPSHLNL